ncbi:MAG: TerD family protein [Actinomycetota bacterium]|nr:TerD family protein [Actinomycetota bacterium]
MGRRFRVCAATLEASIPRGDVTRFWTAPERRGPLPADLVAELRGTVDRELIRRAQLLERFDLAIIDVQLANIPAPTRTRTATSQLAGWTRGSRIPVPGHDVIRLFLHWVELPGTRVDLDLSCAFYRADWSHAGHCDYTTLRFARDAAIHSGDFTSAPAPFGATEFLDLRPSALGTAGVRYAVPVVFSYNDVPFELLPEAFAGLTMPTEADAQFDAARVLQRFDLRGDTRTLVPLILDIENRELLWTDVHLTSRGYGHRAGRHSANLGRLGADLWDHFTSGQRPNLFDLALWHAIGRTDHVLLADTRSRRVTAISSHADTAATATQARQTAPTVGGAGLPELRGRRPRIPPRRRPSRPAARRHGRRRIDRHRSRWPRHTRLAHDPPRGSPRRAAAAVTVRSADLPR